EALTYGELDVRANQLANHLRARGVQRGDAVALCVPRSLDLVVAILGILKAGAAYVPLDSTNPAERLRAIVDDADVVALVATEAFARIVPNPPDRMILVDREHAEIGRESSGAPAGGPSLDDVAYVLFTSGSTGRPKGVEVEHRQLAAYLEAARGEFELSDVDRVLATTSLSFDGSVDELWLPLTVGARVVLAGDDLRLDVRRIVGLLNDGAVTVVAGTPTFAGYLLEAGWQPGDITSLWIGEVLNPPLAAKLLATSRAVWNRYGPTETTDAVAFHRLAPDDVAAGVVPIGHPLAGQVLRVVEASGQLAGIGIEGDLLIGGLGVSRGYRGRPDLTEAAFITVQTEQGATRMYRSGDRCRWRSDGTLEFLGRADGQVKLRGVRMELGEVEAALAAHPSVTTAVVDVRNDRLVAWVTGPDPAPSVDELRRFIGATLPRAMLPNAIEWLEQLPVSTAGKVNRNALPEPTPTGDVPGIPLSGPVEERLAQLWCECLGLDGGVYQDSDFFALGGHSMLAIELALRVERAFGREIPLAQFFTTPTLGEMAVALEGAPNGPNGELVGPFAGAIVPVRKGDDTSALLLWVPGSGGTTLQLRRLASGLPRGVEFMGFEAPPHRGMPEPASLTAMAAAYADDVRGLVRAGVIGAHRPYVLGGNSFGAMVAHELARVLFDDCPPADVILVDPILVPYPPAPPPEPPAKMRAIPRVVRAARRRLRGRAPSPAPMPCSLEQVQRMSRRLREMHEPKVYPGSIVLITSEARRRLLDDELVQMRGFVLGDIVSHPLPGLHSTILADERAEQIAAIAGKVVKNCRR
ncbi:MAG: hypothetical protein QOG30_2137, partial [Acidimicrobiaceae bacterium]